MVIPVKGLDAAKSRLELPSELRRSIALALAERTLGVAAACLPSAAIYVVTTDDAVTELARCMNATVIREVAQGLNPAATLGVVAARKETAGRRACVMVADLPRLTTAELTTVLALADVLESPFVVPDHHARGTTFVSLGTREDIPMLFGDESAAAFASRGCDLYWQAPAGLRRDLDSVEDLRLSAIAHGDLTADLSGPRYLAASNS